MQREARILTDFDEVIVPLSHNLSLESSGGSRGLDLTAALLIVSAVGVR
jgi:hypothetical protein